jgi:hypothetical protein
MCFQVQIDLLFASPVCFSKKPSRIHRKLKPAARRQRFIDSLSSLSPLQTTGSGELAPAPTESGSAFEHCWRSRYGAAPELFTNSVLMVHQALMASAKTAKIISICAAVGDKNFR